MAVSIEPAGQFVSITPGTAFPGTVRGIYVGGSGDLNIKDQAGNTVLFKDLAAGMVHPISPDEVLSSGTTATYILGCY